MSAQLEFRRISVPTDNPGKCQRCNRTHAHSGKKLDIHAYGLPGTEKEGQ